MKATFDNFQLYVEQDLYEAMVEKYGCQSYGDKIAIKTNNSFASWMIAEKIGDKYKITPITSQNNERQSLQMEAYWTVLKEFPIKEYTDVPTFYKQWFVNRGLMKENKIIGENKMAKVKLSKLQTAYREFFKALMDEYDVTSPVQLGDKRSEFFNRVKKEWPAAKKKIKEGVLRQEIREMIVETLNENMLNEKKLPSEDKSKGNAVLKAAKKYFKKSKGINTSFEHGHWWITLDDGSQYDVVDAEGPGTISGFDFEMVTES